MLHYHPDLDVKGIDRHFSDIFPYARTDGETLPEIAAKEVLEVDAVVSVTSSEAAPTIVASEDDLVVS